MTECEEETSMEYGFQIGRHERYYILSFAEKFVYEKLYYFTGKQRGTLFEIKMDDEKILVGIKIANLFRNYLFDTKLRKGILHMSDYGEYGDFDDFDFEMEELAEELEARANAQQTLPPCTDTPS